MFILETSICEKANFLATVLFFRKIVNIISIIVPIILVLLITIDIAKAVMASDDNQIKTAQKLAIKRIIWGLVIFFVPLSVNAVFSLFDGKEVAGITCYNNATDEVVDALQQAENENLLKYEEDIQKLIDSAKEDKEAKDKELERLRELARQQGGGSGSSRVGGYYSNIAATQYTKANGYLAEAASGECGSRGCKAGDQTGKEVRISKFRKGGWVYAARFKDPKKSAILAKCMEDAAKNDNIGYDQNGKDRVSLYKEAKRLNWNIPGITKKVETTCSSVVSVCINAAGVEFPSVVYADNGKMRKELIKTGQFTMMTDRKIIRNKSQLRRGDIIGTTGHTAAVL